VGEKSKDESRKIRGLVSKLDILPGAKSFLCCKICSRLLCYYADFVDIALSLMRRIRR
jgi:hypothetical protein